MWLHGAKYPKLSKVTNICSGRSDLFSGFFLVIFFWLNVVKLSLNRILNSWWKEKLSTNMKLNQKHCILIWKLTWKFAAFSRFCHFLKVTPCNYTLLFSFALRNVPFQRQHVTQIACFWIKLWWPLSAFLPLNLNVFIFENIVQSHFVSVLKTLPWAANCSIVGCSCIMKVLGHYYPQNIWLAQILCKNWGILNNNLKGTQCWKSLSKKFICCWKICEALVVYWLKVVILSFISKLLV